MYIDCVSLHSILKDSAADSKLKLLKKGEVFGEEKPGGEKRIHMGTSANKSEFDAFFFPNGEKTVLFEFSKSDLLLYLIDAKDEFMHPKQSYRLDISTLYDSLLKETMSIKDDTLYVRFETNIDKRYYIARPKGDEYYTNYNYISHICLPYLTDIVFIRAEDETGKYHFFLKPKFINKTDSKLVPPADEDNPYTGPTIQKIFFGSPGTGKSFKIKEEILSGVDDDYIFRTTFHPDTDYASFVGCYKPSSVPLLAIADTGATEEEVIDAFYKTGLESDKLKARYFAEAIYHAADIERLGLKAKDIVAKLEQRGFIKCTYGGELSSIAEAISLISDKLYKSTSNITYKFAPQTFTKAYVKAWQNPTENVYLVIEEINRGNCAQIFGDLFQLLDRDEDGVSEYPIKADADLAKYLQDVLKEDHEGIAGGKIKLPANLHILATMNTSDQSLFPMDSAFKRRWEWRYVPTNVKGDGPKTLKVDSKEKTVLYNRDQEKKVLRLGMYEYDWSQFLEKINKCIADATHSDDKQLGFWFVKTPKGSNEISIETFVSKVIFYLWNDVFKDFGAKATNPFAFKNAEGGWVVCPFSSFFDPYTGEINLGQIHGFMYNLGIIPEVEPEDQDAYLQRIAEEGKPEA